MIFSDKFMIFSGIFPLFLAQNFKTKLLTAQKKSTFRMSVSKTLSIPNRKSLGAEILRKHFTPPCFIYHMSHVTCHMSGVMCNLLSFCLFFTK